MLSTSYVTSKNDTFVYRKTIDNWTLWVRSWLTYNNLAIPINMSLNNEHTFTKTSEHGSAFWHKPVPALSVTSDSNSGNPAICLWSVYTVCQIGSDSVITENRIARNGFCAISNRCCDHKPDQNVATLLLNQYKTYSQTNPTCVTLTKNTSHQLLLQIPV